MKTWMLAGAATLMLAGSALAVQDADATVQLKVGDKAPLFDHVNWIKGAPIPTWEPGHIYVIDFWATWCGPCKASIPHINDLSRKHASSDVTVIGAAIWPRPKMVPTADFVRDKGEDMSYEIAEDIDGATAKAFMQAAGQNGIPTAMVVDREGKIAWIGHPMDGLDSTLDHLVKGDYDPKADAEMRAKAEALQGDLTTAKTEENWAKCADIADQLVALDSGRYAQFAVYSYRFRLDAGDKTAAAAYGRKVSGGVLKDQPQALEALAWSIVDPESGAPPEQLDLDLAMLAARRADELTESNDPSILDTLARVTFLTGNVSGAVALQRKAASLATGADMKAELEARLDEYNRANGKG